MRHSFCKNVIHSLKKLVVKGRGGGAANYTFFVVQIILKNFFIGEFLMIKHKDVTTKEGLKL